MCGPLFNLLTLSIIELFLFDEVHRLSKFISNSFLDVLINLVVDLFGIYFCLLIEIKRCTAAYDMFTQYMDLLDDLVVFVQVFIEYLLLRFKYDSFFAEWLFKVTDSIVQLA